MVVLRSPCFRKAASLCTVTVVVAAGSILGLPEEKGLFLQPAVEKAVQDAVGVIDACKKWDDEFGLPIFDRMKAQQPSMKACLVRMVARLARDAKVVNGAYRIVHDAYPDLLEPYMLDLSRDVQHQLREYSKDSDEWYYWHGLKASLPQKLLLLHAYFKEAVAKADTVDGGKLLKLTPHLDLKIQLKEDDDFDERWKKENPGAEPLPEEEVTNRRFAVRSLRKLRSKLIYEVEGGRDGGVGEGVSTDVKHLLVTSETVKAGGYAIRGASGSAESKEAFETVVWTGDAPKVASAVETWKGGASNVLAGFDLAVFPMRFLRQLGKVVKKADSAASMQSTLTGLAQERDRRFLLPEELKESAPQKTLFGLILDACPSERKLQKLDVEFNGPDAKQPGDKMFRYLLVPHSVQNPCGVDAAKLGFVLIADPGKFPLATSAAGDPAGPRITHEDYLLEDGSEGAEPYFPADPFKKWIPEEAVISEVQNLPVVVRGHRGGKIQALDPAAAVKTADEAALQSAGLLLRRDHGPWIQPYHSDANGKSTSAGFAPPFPYPAALVEKLQQGGEVVPAGAAAADSGAKISQSVFAGGGINAKHFEQMDEYKRQFYENEDLIIAEDFFDRDTFAKIEAESHRLWSAEEMEPNCNLDGRDRLGGYVLDDLDHHFNLSGGTGGLSFYQLIYNNPALQYWVSYIYGKRMWASDFPIELREYGDGSSGMRCHRDLALFADDTIDAEFAFTVANSSPTHEVSFTDRAGKEHRLKPKANTLLMVRPNASLHCAHGVDPGSSRQMMKWIFTGAYKKDRRFGMYAKNDCGKQSLSWKALMAKKSSSAAGGGQGGGGQEL